MKYVDDLTLAESVDLRTKLREDTNPIRPLTYHSRTCHILPANSSGLQQQLDDLMVFSEANSMKINNKKTKVMIFNPYRTRDFPPGLTLQDTDTYLEIIEEIKLVGIIVSSDLKWRKNTKKLIRNGMSKIWMLRRLKKVGASVSELMEVYRLEIRYCLELAAPVWHSGITKEESDDLERVQRVSLSVILGEHYHTHEIALTLLEEELLEDRRESQCLTFARKFVIDPRHKNKFSTPPTKTVNTRYQNPNKYAEVITRTKRFYKSPIPYFTRLLNSADSL